MVILSHFTIQSLFLSLIFSNLCYRSRSPSLKAFCFDNRLADTTDPSVVRVAVRRTVLCKKKRKKMRKNII